MPKPKLSPEVILGFLKRRFGTVDGLVSLREGLVSQAFEFSRGGDRYVIRIGVSTDGYEKDRFIWHAFGGKGLPVPAVLDVGALDESHAFCISSRLPGTQLHELGGDAAAALSGAVVELLQRIGGAEVPGTVGFGLIDGSGEAGCRTWRDYLIGVTEAPVPPTWKGDQAELSRVVGALKAIVVARAGSCPQIRRLVHGDFGSYNLLSDGRIITGIVDWDMAKFGDPLFDVANVFFWDEEVLRPVAAALSRLGKNEPDWRERLECYQACIGLFEIGASLWDRNEAAADWLLKRCAGLLALWEDRC